MAHPRLASSHQRRGRPSKISLARRAGQTVAGACTGGWVPGTANGRLPRTSATCTRLRNPNARVGCLRSTAPSSWAGVNWRHELTCPGLPTHATSAPSMICRYGRCPASLCAARTAAMVFRLFSSMRQRMWLGRLGPQLSRHIRSTRTCRAIPRTSSRESRPSSMSVASRLWRDGLTTGPSCASTFRSRSASGYAAAPPGGSLTMIVIDQGESLPGDHVVNVAVPEPHRSGAPRPGKAGVQVFTLSRSASRSRGAGSG